MRDEAFTEAEHATWRALWSGLDRARRDQAHPVFNEGLHALGIDGRWIPALDAVNVRLEARTGWRGVPAAGLVGPVDFFAGLARREFPVGSFIRDGKDLGYTPAPDVFHDLYGHLPLLADRAYADFCQRFGVVASEAAADPAALRRFERLFWFGVEFPLVETPAGRRIFGGGILSSSGECDHALGPLPEVRRFDRDAMMALEYRIDVMQPVLFVLETPEELYRCLDDLR